MAADLPPIGTWVRINSGDFGKIDMTATAMAMVRVRIDHSHSPGSWYGVWVTADEIEEVLNDG